MAETSRIPVHVVYPSEAHTHTFILLHDCVSSGASLCAQLEAALKPVAIRDILPQVRFVFPNGEHPLPGYPNNLNWFSLSQLGDSNRRGLEHEWTMVADAARTLDALVTEEALEVGWDNVFVGGIGMGAAVGMAFLLQTTTRLGGFFGLGGWMPFVDDLSSIATRGVLDRDVPLAMMLPPAPMMQSDDMETLENLEMFPGLDPCLVATFPQQENTQEGEPQTKTELKPGGEPETKRPASAPAAPKRTPTNNLPQQSGEDRLTRVISFFRSFISTEADEQSASQTAVDTPVVLVHAVHDSSVPRTHGKEALEIFKKLGFQATLISLDDGDHLVSHAALMEFLTAIMNKEIGTFGLREGIAMLLLG
ncbi:hypothetical protein AK830_g12451 [Neonectria ditissima]|uniref:Phospholipase/carboxylesterase/thioesterase domain-containing protein n=1 Tax=Neonectria ditissima TaxID=78410 RepID=A0A0N8H4R7_9HYPO|nr:hypothetical protein AK830_g12451 [Neonectria ditissima]